MEIVKGFIRSGHVMVLNCRMKKGPMAGILEYGAEATGWNLESIELRF
jgi:hypothetical protein